MASQRMVRREKKRIKLYKIFAKKRAELTAQLRDPSADIDAKIEILEKIEKMPRDSSRIRSRRRCNITGRGRGVYRKFGLARSELRRRCSNGEVPGLVKASW